MARTVDPVKHAEKRKHIQDQAAVLFAHRGYDRTTTATICSAAGVSAGNLYHYFRSKKQIFIEILTSDQQNTEEELRRCLQQEDRLRGVLDFLHHLAAPAAERPIVPQLVLEAMIQARRDPAIRAVLEEAGSDERAGVAALLRRACAAGVVDISLDPDAAASWLCTLVGALYLEGATNPAFDPRSHLAHLRRTAHAYLTQSEPTPPHPG